MKRKIFLFLSMALLSFPRAALAADSPSTQPAPTAPTVSVSPQLLQAIAQLSADDYQDRQAATAKIQAALADSVHQMVLLDDPEARNRMAAIMDYNAALSRWAIATLQLPRDQRQANAQWATSPQVAPLIARIYSSHDDQRVAGIKDLAKDDCAQAGLLLARLIEDGDRTVRLAAIDASRNHALTLPILNALWSVAIGSATPAVDPNMPAMAGRRGSYYTGNRSQDVNLAVDVLVAFKSPQIAERLRAFLIDNKNAAHPAPLLVNFTNNPMQGIVLLAEAYQTKEAVPLLMKAVLEPANSVTAFNFPGRPAYITSRTGAMAAICLIIGQKPSDYKLRFSTEVNQWCAADAAGEGQAADALCKWYDSHRADFDPATRPATQPAGK